MLLKTEYWTDEEHEPINPYLWAETVATVYTS